MGLGFLDSLNQTGRHALDFLFPPVCITCRVPLADSGHLCGACWSEIKFLDGPQCAACGLPFDFDPGSETLCAPCHTKHPHYDSARAIMHYDDKSRGPILALKYADRLELVPGFSRWMNRTGRDFIAGSDVIIPVPLHPLRLWRRRYNQSAELARHLAKATGKPYDGHMLLRGRPTPSQSAMPSARARRRNVAAAFTVPDGRKAATKDRAILLVDDVMTTGATVDACARALKKAGAAKVFVLTLARVVRAQDVPI